MVVAAEVGVSEADEEPQAEGVFDGDEELAAGRSQEDDDDDDDDVVHDPEPDCAASPHGPQAPDGEVESSTSQLPVDEVDGALAQSTAPAVKRPQGFDDVPEEGWSRCVGTRVSTSMVV